MKNITMTTNGNILTITIDLNQSFGMSASGKSVIIASTEGNQSVPGAPDGTAIGLNVYTKAAKAPKKAVAAPLTVTVAKSADVVNF